jgi:hypothetical protein
MNDNDINAQLVLKKPHECILMSNYAKISELLPFNLIQTYLSRYFIHPFMYESSKSPEENDYITKLMINLGVKQFDVDDLVCLLKNVFNLNKIDNPTTITKWLTICEEFYLKLNSTNASRFLNELKKIKFIPCSNDVDMGLFSLDTLNHESIYFPIFDYDRYNVNKVILSLIQNELNLIDLTCLAIDYNSSLVKFLANLGMCRILNLLYNAISPIVFNQRHWF